MGSRDVFSFFSYPVHTPRVTLFGRVFVDVDVDTPVHPAGSWPCTVSPRTRTPSRTSCSTRRPSRGSSGRYTTPQLPSLRFFPARFVPCRRSNRRRCHGCAPHLCFEGCAGHSIPCLPMLDPCLVLPPVSLLRVRMSKRRRRAECRQPKRQLYIQFNAKTPAGLPAATAVRCCSAVAEASTWTSTLDGWPAADATETTSRSKRSVTPSRSG